MIALPQARKDVPTKISALKIGLPMYDTTYLPWRKLVEDQYFTVMINVGSF